MGEKENEQTLQCTWGLCGETMKYMYIFPLTSTTSLANQCLLLVQTVFQALVFSVRHYPVLVPSELWTEGEALMPLPTVFLGILWVLVAQCLQSIFDLTNRRFVLCLALPVQKYKIFVHKLIYLYECNDFFFL